MHEFEISLNSITIYDYKFVLDITLPKQYKDLTFNLLRKEQLISDSISLYYRKNNNNLLFYSVFSQQLLSEKYSFLSHSSNGFLYSLSSNNTTLEKILHNIYFNINIPKFPILLKETSIF